MKCFEDRLRPGVARLLLREESCLKWAIKAQANPQHAHLFPVRQTEVTTRSGHRFEEYWCRGTKFYTSAVPAMVRALNASGVQPASSRQLTTKYAYQHCGGELWSGGKLSTEYTVTGLIASAI